MSKILPQNITFQWHITDQCNLRCKHCYQDDYVESGLPLNSQYLILNQLTSFVNKVRKQNNRVRAHINFTGGEPFLRKDFLDLINKTKETGLFSFAILSNGFLISDNELKKLASAQPSFIQLSLEGGESKNDEIRGKGSFKQVTKAVKTYRELKIPVMISFTANSSNYKEFGKVVRYGIAHKVNRVWTDRYLPINKEDDLILTTTQTQDFFKIIKKFQNRKKYFPFSKTYISSNRALQFLVSGGRPYKCSAGNTLLAILPNGDLLPCRRLPIKIGNLLQEDLLDMYTNSIVLKDIRKPVVDEKCMVCHYKTSCAGGLKCLSYAYYNNYKLRDPNCWL